MKVVGVGAGPGMITVEAIRAIKEAKRVYGSSRALELAAPHVSPGCEITIIEDYKKLRDLGKETVVLSTGDPMLGGLGYLGGEIIPGISSLQVACARLGISELQVLPITVHGRKLNPDSIADEIRRGWSVFLLVDKDTDLDRLCAYLERVELSRIVAVLSDLGYPEERIDVGSTAHPPKINNLSCVIIGRLSAREQPHPG
jgi:cobalt-precorrin-7 (C5)-methyltransferase